MATRWQSGLHHLVSVYAKQVTAGKLRSQCCEYEILACQRHLNDLKRQGTEEFPYVFDTTRADRIIRWFLECRHVRGVLAGKPIEMQPWQVFDQGCLYGWVRMDTGARRFRKTYHKRARGNVKSTENSCKCLYQMCGDAIYPPYQPELAQFEMEPEVEIAAVDRGQAMRVFGDAKKIAAASPSIAQRLHIPKSNPVVHLTRGGYMRALSKDTKNKDSGAPSYISIDEYHAHATSEIYAIGQNSGGKRAQFLQDVITTAGDDADEKPCYTEELYAMQLLRGEVANETYFVMIREIDNGDNPHDETCWYKANPVLRYPNAYSKELLIQIRSEYTEAFDSGDATKIRHFLIRRMCRWQAGGENKYLTEEQMRLARSLQVSRNEFARLTDGLSCFGGFDLGKRIDLSGAGAVFSLPDGRIAIKAHGFMPQNGATRHEHSDKMEYRQWAEGGHCTLTPGDVTDNSYVYGWFCKHERENDWSIEEFDYDGHNATDLAIAIQNERGEDSVVQIAQTCAGQNLAVKTFRELLLQGKLVFEENPLFMRCLGNAVEIENNYGDIKLSKRHKDDSQRIDPLAAVMNALARLLVRREKPTLSDAIARGNYSM